MQKRINFRQQSTVTPAPVWERDWGVLVWNKPQVPPMQSTPSDEISPGPMAQHPKNLFLIKYIYIYYILKEKYDFITHYKKKNQLHCTHRLKYIDKTAFISTHYNLLHSTIICYIPLRRTTFHCTSLHHTAQHHKQTHTIVKIHPTQRKKKLLKSHNTPLNQS